MKPASLELIVPGISEANVPTWLQFHQAFSLFALLFVQDRSS
jgi:hypothetical protein